MRDSEERFRDFAEAASDWFWEQDADFRFTYFSGGLEGITGVLPKDFLGRTRWELVGADPDNDELWRCHCDDLVAHRSFRDFRYCYSDRKGRRRYWKVSGRPMFGETGRFRGYRGTATDETAEVEARNRAEAAETRLMQALEAASEGFALFDADDRLVFCNQRYRRLVAPADVALEPGTTFEAYLLRNLELGLVEDAVGQEQDWLEWRLSHHRNPSGPIEIQRKNNVCLRVLEERLPDGTTFLVARDATEEKRREEELRQAQKMQSLGTLAGGIAHDFNNMLVPMLGLTELALHDLPEESLARSNLTRVLDAGQRARDLVHRILAFSRRDQSQRQPVQPRAVVGEVLKLLRATLPSSIEIREETDATKDVTILADPTQVHQLLMNLASNAAHAMGEAGGLLTVSLEVVEVTRRASRGQPGLNPGPHLRLRVSDTGCGMDRETSERIFDPFFTTKDVGEGTGLGLSAVHGIVANHGGAVTVESEPGKGTTFSIYFPVSTAASAVAAAVPAA